MDLLDLQANSSTLEIMSLFSPICNTKQAAAISHNAGASVTNDLGRYLGTKLIHGRHNKEVYTGRLDKFNNRLADWKAKNL